LKASWVVGLWMVASLLQMPSAGAATQVYKCTGEGSVVYQAYPCPTDEVRKRPTAQELNAKRQQEASSSAQSAVPVGRPSDSKAKVSEPLPAPSPRSSAGNVLRVAEGRFQCDGRKYCSQMRSCEEAKYFLAHCSGVRMDGHGRGNGVPCEQQWCTAP
jgi:hypothetical protein